MADSGSEASPDRPDLTTAPVEGESAPTIGPAVDQDRAEGTDRVLTIPNVLSVIRLACIPLFLWLLFGRDQRADAAILLAVLGATDWVDGWVARRYHQVSALGKILDPTADRLLLAVGVVAILIDGSVPVVVAVLTIVRESLVAVAALVLASMGAKRIDVTWAGKAGTFGMLFAYPLFLAGNSDLFWADTADVLAWMCAVPGLVFGYISAAGYVPLARRALQDGRSRTAGVHR
ncbi:MAG: CDP-alcohol phosphatidyltransferase family protein [Actinomycetota bacterium]|nr:CDP-alcohol phosphatidyltransferase family protein [Actinomycetota bacterium]